MNDIMQNSTMECNMFQYNTYIYCNTFYNVMQYNA